MQQTLSDYRDWVYLQNLNNDEFIIFAEDVATDLEGNFPIYTEMVKMPSVNDTVDYYVVTNIVEELKADASNMKNIFPYHSLVKAGVLPEKLTHDQQKSYYGCFANKVNDIPRF